MGERLISNIVDAGGDRYRGKGGTFIERSFCDGFDAAGNGHRGQVYAVHECRETDEGNAGGDGHRPDLSFGATDQCADPVIVQDAIDAGEVHVVGIDRDRGQGGAMIERIEEYKINSPGDNWDGVFRTNSK